MARIFLISSNITKDPFPVYPLGLAVIASALAARGHTLEQFDFLVAGESEDAFRERLKSFLPEFVCISVRNLDNCDSCTATTYPSVAKRMIEVVRETCPAQIIIGGSAFSILPEEILAFTGADYGVVGEGEQIICELINDLSAGRTPPRILSCDTLIPGEALITPLYSQELVDFYLEQSGMINLQTKRGCPQGCIYCSYPSLEGSSYRFRDPRAVVDDMERAKVDHGVENFFFTDSVFNDTEGHYVQVVEELLRRDQRFHWCCYIRPEGIRRSEIAQMKRSGLFAAELGTDAACDTTLRSLGKGFSFAEALEVNRAFVAERVPCSHFVMFGAPGETIGTVTESLENLDRLDHTVVFAFSGIRILPGTSLYLQALREGFLTKDTPLVEPVFYQSPWVAGELMNAMITKSFHGRRDRIFPPESYMERRDVLLRFGYRGILWDSLVQFPADLPC